MPPRKEPKEAVIYPASKRKVPAFKPLRPSKVPRTESESSTRSQPAAKKPPAKKVPAKPAKSIAISDSEDDDENLEHLVKDTAAVESEEDDSEILGDDPLNAKTTAMRNTSTRDPSPPDDLDDASNDPPMPTQSDDIHSIPQPLLLRLLHEAFFDKNTKIDKHAIQVFQKYIEIFIRESIARAQLERSEAADRGEVTQADAGWLEVEDLEKAAPALFLDF